MQYPIVVIGAGFCGMIALKTCKEEGLDAICFEKTDNIGGLWRFRENDFNGIGSVTRTTDINTSKEVGSMSDFPPPKGYANFMHHSKNLSYLEKYAEHFKLLESIRFEYEVLKVSKARDFKETGEWTVVVRNKGDVSEMRSSAVMVCIGLHIYPNVPSFHGQSEFRGTIMHTHSYKGSSFANLAGKNALVIGIGNSGADAAAELSQVFNKVYLSTRRGAWIVERLGANGKPSDFAMSRYDALVHKYFPGYHNNKMEKDANSRFDHDLYNLKPKHRFDGQHLTLSDSLPSRIMCGAVIVKSDICRFTEEGVIFEGEPGNEYEIDTVILATGYQYKFPFLDGNDVSVENNEVELYKRVLPPRLSHQTLAIIGMIQPIGPVFPAAELQSRWFAKILKGKIKLPRKDTQLAEIRNYMASVKSRYVVSPRHTIEVDFVPYMDSLAVDIKCKPNLFKLFFTDHTLFHSLMFGPPVPYQYRLSGPNSWPGARNAILTVHDRMCAPFNTKFGQQSEGTNYKNKSSVTWYFMALTALTTGIGVYYAFHSEINAMLTKL